MGRICFRRGVGIALTLGLCAVNAHARIENSTLDYDQSSDFDARAMGVDAAEAGFAGPWSAFFAKIPGFSRVQFWDIAAGGRVPVAKNSSLPLAPASVMKMVTAASALKNLSREFQFTNFFEGQVDADTHQLLVPRFTVSGDPTWGHEQYEGFQDRLARIIVALKNLGVKEVVGPVLVAATRPELDQIPSPQGWPKRWTLQCMATQPTSFMLNGNCGSIQLQSLTQASWVTPGVDIPIHLKLVRGRKNQLIIAGNPDAYGRIQSYVISGQFATPTRSFYDPLQAAYTDSVPVHSGIHWLQNLFSIMLSENGIAQVPTLAEIQTGAKHRQAFSIDLSSLPLVQVLKIAMQASINGIMDRTFQETYYQQKAEVPAAPSYSVLRELANDSSLLSGIEIFDGSGLNVDDRLRSDTLVAFLRNIQNQFYFPDFLSTLSVAGVSGTLQDRLKGPLTRAKIFAKTGTIDGIYNLAGYFRTAQSSYQPFSFLSQSTLPALQVRGMLDRLTTEFAYLNTND